MANQFLKKVVFISILLSLILILFYIILSFTNNRPTTTSKPTVAISNNLRDRYLETLSPDEKKLFFIDKKNSQAKKDNFDLIKKVAVPTNKIQITSCYSSPLAIKIPFQDELAWQNNDNVPHTIQISEHHSYQIPAKGVIVTPADFGYGIALYGYNCDGSHEAGGIIFVNEKADKRKN